MAEFVQVGGKIAVQGELTVECIKNLMQSATDIFTTTAMVIDLGGVTAADSAGVATLFALQRQASAVKSSIVFENIPESIKTLASLYDVLDFIPLQSH